MKGNTILYTTKITQSKIKYIFLFIYTHKINYLAKGLAWIVTEFNLVSVKGWNVFGLTGSFSSSSRVSKPSITLSKKKKIEILN